VLPAEPADGHMSSESDDHTLQLLHLGRSHTELNDADQWHRPWFHLAGELIEARLT